MKKSMEFTYRKAEYYDIIDIAKLVTDLLGTCNLNLNKSILENNIDSISKDINNYYVCLYNNKVIGACGLSDVIKKDRYNLKLENIREILYFVVNKKYQGLGIGTKLLNMCSNESKENIIYEAWGDNGKYVNSKFILERCGYKLYKDLGKKYYKSHNYCNECVNRYKGCDECLAQIWIKQNNYKGTEINE